jgi:hypothetical protein
MTPLHLDILSHYYTRGGDYELIPDNETRTEYAYQLAKMGLLYTPKRPHKGKGLLFAITDLGKLTFRKCLSCLDDVYRDEDETL